MKKKFKMKIDKIIDETHDSKSLVLIPVESEDGLYDFSPGQFFMLESNISRPENIVYDKTSKKMIGSGNNVDVVERKAYSIVSSPTQKDSIELLVKSESGVFAPYFLDQINIGDVCYMEGPQGKFMNPIFENKHKFIACWSAGSGIPSSISLMNYSIDNDLDLSVVVFDSNKTKNDIIYHERIKETVAKSNKFKAVFTLTREKPNDMPKSNSENVFYSSGRFWSDEENTLKKYTDNRSSLIQLISKILIPQGSKGFPFGKETNWKDYFNTICGSSSFINGKGRDNEGKLAKLGNGIEDHLLNNEIDPKLIDKDQYYLQ